MRNFSILAFLFLSLTASAQTIELIPPSATDAAGVATWTVVLTNPGPLPTEPRQLRVDFTPNYPVDGHVAGVPSGCHWGNARQTACEPVVLAPGERRELQYRFQLDAPYGLVFVYATFGEGVSTTHLAVLPRPFAVTTTADSGPGSLRQALLDINLLCTTTDPCGPAFAIDAPYTIRPLSPLPKITAKWVAFHGDSKVVLDGSLAGTGNGLELVANASTFTGMTVVNFPENGVQVTHGSTTVERSRFSGNGSRGLQVDEGSASIVASEFDSNKRAGAWLTSEGDIAISRSRFTRNGASGLYIDVRRPRGYNYGTVQDNVFAWNAHAGISLSRNSTGMFAQNHFVGNHGRAIDIGIDGLTRFPSPGLPGLGGVMGAPVITSARYDASRGETVIEGRLADRIPNGVAALDLLYLYANTEARDGGLLFHGPVRIQGPQFTVRIPGDLRAYWISAGSYTTYISGFDDPVPATSEISVPVRVE